MSQHIRAQLVDHLRATAIGAGRVDAVLTLPPNLTADAPVWSPEPRYLASASAAHYLEIATAAVWAKPVGDGLAQVVAHHEGDDRDLMVGGLVGVEDLLGPGGVHANPGQLTRRADLGTASVWHMAADHPMMTYRRWVHRWDQEILLRLQQSGTRFSSWPAHRVQRLPDRSWQVVFAVLVNGCSASSAATSLARTLHRLVRFYGPLGRLRICESDESRFHGPLHSWACQAFAPHTAPSTHTLAKTG
ncbi:hypothetical protein [Alloactinosynnema sp. L-07]|uniref:hypothetical protein n=1 Tax=Alloactinosynnema sp. L-07 TaxID=1653480 RepID=UPI00065F00FA|nr:hypothetical protein [Alloactinosynnema sp. L-07]CRK56923.1 hypothetical protein [Alloactinosynnema sp. L-07]